MNTTQNTRPSAESTRADLEVDMRPRTEALPLRPTWHRPILTRIAIQRTMVNSGANVDGIGPSL